MDKELFEGAIVAGKEKIKKLPLKEVLILYVNYSVTYFVPTNPNVLVPSSASTIL